jgi:hypothetical protein
MHNDGVVQDPEVLRRMERGVLTIGTGLATCLLNQRQRRTHQGGAMPIRNLSKATHSTETSQQMNAAPWRAALGEGRDETRLPAMRIMMR